MSPDGSTPIPPEEKLLRLIRGKGAAPSTGGVTGSSAAQERSTPRSSAPLGMPRWLVRWRLPAWGALVANLGLGMLLIGELVALLVVSAKPEPSVTIALPPSPSSTPSPEADEPVIAAPSLTTVASRPLFHVQDVQAPAGVVRATSSEAKMLAARLNLIGIVAGEPAQAIIEDADTKKTFFVTVGQALIEGLVVEQVESNRVILDLNGEKITLSL